MVSAAVDGKSGVGASCGLPRIELEGVDESNLSEVLALAVGEEQRRFVPSSAGILARAWSHRAENAEVYVIRADGACVGLIIVYDVTEEPACHYIMEFAVDARFQGKGYGAAALERIKRMYSAVRRFPRIEASVDRENAAALRLFARAGFEDGGYTDPELPQYVNLIYPLG